MRGCVLLGVAVLALYTQATPYQGRYYNSSVPATSTQRLPPPPGSLSSPATCTGCVIEAPTPITYTFAEGESSLWTSVIKTETVLTKTVSYFTGTPAVLQTVVTEIETLSQTAALTGAYNEIITYTTPVFTVEPAPGVTLELPSGTYLFYDKIYGGLNVPFQATKASSPVTVPAPTAPGYVSWHALKERVVEPTCIAAVESLRDAMPTRAEDWRHFYHSVTGVMPLMDGATPEALPPALLRYLNNVPNIKNALGGSNISSCTPISTPFPGTTVGTVGEETPTSIPEQPFPSSASAPLLSSIASIGAPPAFGSTTRITSYPTTTYIRTTYQTTSTHLTVQGCLRCDTPYHIIPVQTRQQDVTGGDNHVPGRPGSPGQSSNQPPGGGQIIPVGDTTLAVYPAKPTKAGQAKNSGQKVVIGTLTLAPGQTATINDVPIVVPTAGGGSIVVVGTNTYQVLPTSPPIFTVGAATLIANAQSQYIVGSQTISPGGPAIIVDGYTLSLGSDGNRMVVNGVTQTIENSPYATEALVLTVGGRIITPTIIDGTTQLIVGPATPTASASTTGPQDGTRFIETGASTSSKGSAVSIRSTGLDIWVESLIMGIASWTLMLL